MQSFFDLLITLFFLITAYPAVILLYSKKKRLTSWEYQHKNISLFISIILLICTALLLYGSFIEPRLLITNYQEINLGLNKPIKIAFFSDLHVGKYKNIAWAEKVVQRIIELKPDMVLIGGDETDNEEYNPEELTYLEPLKKLAEQIPTYAVQGNHEYGIGSGKPVLSYQYRVADIHTEITETLTKLDIITLANDLKKITINSSSFYLFGGEEYWSRKLDFSSLENRTEKIPTIALIHNPSFIQDAFPTDIDLILSGHTHGGQIRLPFLGPLGITDDFLPRQYYQGLHQLTSNTRLFVTSGVGESGARARLFNPPEIVLLTIE